MLYRISVPAHCLQFAIRCNTILVLIWHIWLVPVAKTQGEIGILTGISNYQGDLASHNTTNGLNVLIGPVIGVTAGYTFSDYFQWRSNLLYTRISGDDALNPSENTRSRNLHFFSPVIQWTMGMEWNMLGFSTDGQKRFTPYLTTGGSLFYFNPKTEYMGEKIALQPLGTEGQFLDDYPDQKPYSRFQPALIFGGGLKLLTSDQLIIAAEAMMTYTFTDYLDDASTIYISYPELIEKASPLTAALANRQGEFFGTEPVIVPTGSFRANSKSKDYFGTITLKACLPVRIESNTFKVRRHQNRKVNCPRF